MGAHNDPALRALAAGVLWPGFLGTDIPGWLAHALDDGLAGVVYFAHNLDQEVPERVAALSAGIRSHRADVLIGIDEEGGPVTRLHARHGSLLPSHAQLGALDDPVLTRRVGASLGAESLAAGINVVLAPVGDVNTNPLNPVIGVRSFGSEPALVSRHVAAMIAGIQSQRVAACVKHFPGHGDTAVDSHLGLPRFSGDHETLLRDHLPPFAAAIEAGVASVMTTHVVAPSLGELPATVNPRSLGLLREMGFTGVIVTDALDMGAIRDGIGMAEGAVRSLLAGADLLCIGNPANPGYAREASADENDYLTVLTAVLDAVDEGRIAPELLEQAGERNRAMAAAAPSVGQSDDDYLGAVREAFVLTGADAVEPAASGPLTIVDVRGKANLAVGDREHYLATALGSGERVIRVPARDPRALGEWESASEGIGAGERIVVVCDALHEGSPQRAVVAAVLVRHPDALVINLGLVPEPAIATPVLTTSGDSRVTATAVAQLLNGEAR